MRYSCTVLVLATALISRVAAGPVKHSHAHAHFHAKKDAALKVEAEVEKKDLSDVDWAEVDYSSVDWDKVDYTYSAGQAWGAPTPAPSNDAPATTAAAPAPAGTTAAPAPAPAKPAAAVVDVASTVLAAGDHSKLLSLGFAAVGVNAAGPGGSVWIGSEGPYTNEFINSAAEDVILVVWGPAASWVNVGQPLITHSLPAGSSVTLSFASGTSGAWSAVYPDTVLVDGQVSNSWGEFTFSPEGVVDVSREPNMNGHAMSIVGPSCTSDFGACVFQCTGGQTSCEFGYELVNCAAGSQPGAQYGEFEGTPSGGCGWLGAATASLTTTFT